MLVIFTFRRFTELMSAGLYYRDRDERVSSSQSASQTREHRADPSDRLLACQLRPGSSIATYCLLQLQHPAEKAGPVYWYKL